MFEVLRLSEKFQVGQKLFIQPININEVLKEKVSVEVLSLQEILTYRKSFGLPTLQKDDFDENAIHIAIKYNGDFLACLRINIKEKNGVLPFEQDSINKISCYNGNISVNSGDIEIGRLVISKANVIKYRIENINSYIQEIINFIKLHLTENGKIFIAIVDYNIKKDRYIKAGFTEISRLSSDKRYGGLEGSLLGLKENNL